RVAGHVRAARRDGGRHVSPRIPGEHRRRLHRGHADRAMNGVEAPVPELPPRRSREGLARWLTLAAFGLFVAGCAGAIQLNSTISDIAATLPPTPDVATLPVSVAVTDRNGMLLRPF